MQQSLHERGQHPSKDINTEQKMQSSNKIVNQWLSDLAYSAATWDLKAHMALVSRSVIVTGIPGKEQIDYNGWKLRRHNEFKKKLLRGLSHRKVKLIEEQPDSIFFTVLEQMRSHQNQCIELEKEVTLVREEDGKWRVVKENILRIEAKKHCTI
ncbi:MAG: hypothetical protein OEZ16_02750 [Chromatiales bacterium]|nr:hypothetical protein [Chromatiales bacterium]